MLRLLLLSANHKERAEGGEELKQEVVKNSILVLFASILKTPENKKTIASFHHPVMFLIVMTQKKTLCLC